MAAPRNSRGHTTVAERYRTAAQIESEKRRIEIERARHELQEKVSNEIGAISGLNRPLIQNTNGAASNEAGSREEWFKSTSARSELEAEQRFPRVQRPQTFATPTPSAADSDSAQAETRSIADLQALVKQQSSLIQHLRTDLESERKTAAQLQIDKNEVEERYEQARIDEDHQQRAKLQRQLDNAKDVLKQKREEIHGLQGRIAELEEKEWELKQQLKQSRRANLTLESRLVEGKSPDIDHQRQPHVGPAAPMELADSSSVGGEASQQNPRHSNKEAIDDKDKQSMTNPRSRSCRSESRKHRHTRRISESDKTHAKGAFISYPRGEKRSTFAIPFSIHV